MLVLGVPQLRKKKSIVNYECVPDFKGILVLNKTQTLPLEIPDGGDDDRSRVGSCLDEVDHDLVVRRGGRARARPDHDEVRGALSVLGDHQEAVFAVDDSFPS